MDRRGLLRSAACCLLALAAPGRGRTMAAMRPAVDPAPGAGRRVRLFLCGDVMSGRGVDQLLPHPSDPLIHETYMKSALAYVRLAERANGPLRRPVGFSYVWGDALAELGRAAPDLRIANLETSVTRSDDFWPRKGINYRMHPGNAPLLRAAGLDCCVLANNHVLDWGYAGLQETLDTLPGAGIRAAGAGRDLAQARAPAVFELRGKGRVVVLSVAAASSGVPSAWAAGPGRAGVNFVADLSAASAAAITEQVRASTRPGDLVVLSIHWGGNWGYAVPAAQREFAHRLIDGAGVDVVHGHSSHHPRGIEVYRDRPIIYGCGDFINDYEGIGGHEAFRGDLSLMYFLDLDPADGKLLGLRMAPLQIRKFRLNRASPQDAAWLGKTLDRESRVFGCRVELAGNGALALHWQPGKRS